jgi:hypothetical protein
MEPTAKSCFVSVPLKHQATPVGDADASDRIEHVVLKLNGICRAATYEFATAVGRLVIDEFYRGDPTKWRERGLKSVSFRKLSRHPRLPMSPAALYRCVAIYELCQRIGIKEWRHVSTSHMRLVLPLGAVEQKRLLLHAEADRWSVRQLTEEIRKWANAHDLPETDGRAGASVTVDSGGTVQILEECMTIVDSVRREATRVADFASTPTIHRLTLRLKKLCLVLRSRVERDISRCGDASSTEPELRGCGPKTA